jgi:hypothetical protein
MWKLATALARLLHWWWRCDRIRAPPSEGRLLRLVPPCFLRIAGEPVEVVSRHVAFAGDSQLILHRCQGEAGDFELAIRLTAGGPEVRMRRGECEWLLAAEDVEVIPGAACYRRSSTRSHS